MVCRENQNMHFVFSNFFFNWAIYEIMWKNFVERGRPQMTIRCIHIACWIMKATHMPVLCNTDCFLTATVVARTRFSVTFICTLPILFTVNSIHALTCYTPLDLSLLMTSWIILQVVTFCISFSLFQDLLFRVVTILFLRISHCLHDALPVYVIGYSLVFMLLAWVVGGCKLCVSQGCVLCLCVMMSAFHFPQKLLVVGIW